jgi:heavy metal translocating P-type ATPase
MAEAVRPCRLCQAPLRKGAAADEEFCCSGCARVHAVIAGLDASAGATYLAAARALGIVPQDSGAPPPAEPGADAPSHLLDDAESIREERFRADGMFCPSCAWVIEKVLGAQEGVAQARFDFMTGTGVLRYDLRQTSPDRLAGMVRPLGYTIAPLVAEGQERLSRGVTFRFMVAAVITMNLMSLSVVRYALEVGWLDEMSPLVAYLELLLCLPVLALGLVPIARRAASSLRHGAMTMDLLITLSVLAAFALSLAAMVAGRTDIYFETAAVLVTIALLSRTIEARLRVRAMRDTAALMHMDAARVRLDGEPDDRRERFIPVEDVQPGALLRFHPDEMIPFDGRCANDAQAPCLVSEAVLTGEPKPLRKLRGDRVTAGSRLVEGALRLEVTRAFRDTRLAEIARAIREGLASSETRLRSSDRIAAWFVPSVVALAVAVWLARALLFGWAYALSAPGWFPSVALLAVACPCAFSLAGATALLAGSGALLKMGFLVREQGQLEALHRTDIVVFDKTGTLTEGNVVVEGIAWRGEPRPDLLARVLAAEQGSEHPIARAIRHHLVEQGIVEASGGTVGDLPGQGRRLLPPGAHEPFLVGRSSLFADGFEVPGLSPKHGLAWFGPAGRAEGCFLVSDRIRAGAGAVVAFLRDTGLKVELLSGDRQSVCDGIAAELGIATARGGVSLDEKVAHIRALGRQGHHVTYIGDGTNDALAMAAASASIAIAGSTDEALAASGFVLLRQELAALPTLFRLGHRLHRIIRGNYLWAFGFNGVFVPVAAAGYLTPLFASLLMFLSSTAVLLNSLRLSRRRPAET